MQANNPNRPRVTYIRMVGDDGPCWGDAFFEWFFLMILTVPLWGIVYSTLGPTAMWTLMAIVTPLYFVYRLRRK